MPEGEFVREVEEQMERWTLIRKDEAGADGEDLSICRKTDRALSDGL